MGKMVTCLLCNTKNPIQAKFCENCGKILPKGPAKTQKSLSCTICGSSYETGNSFCENCGTAIPKDSPGNTKIKGTAASKKNSVIPREERYLRARQLALKLAQKTNHQEKEDTFVYIGEKII